MRKVRALVFVYAVRPVMHLLHRFGWVDDICACPVCGELLRHYEADGYLHLADGDADCFGALGVGKG